MTKTVSKSDLSLSRRRLVELMQDINFGRIEGLHICGGEPVLDASPRVVREIKIGGDNGPRAERAANDFLLKDQVVELLEHLSRLRNTTIEVLEREEFSHIKAQASGADNKIGSRMKLDLDVNLRAQDDKTILGFVAGVDILGKLAALGHGIIKRKADQVLDEFAQAVKKRLEGDA